jgi:uncharacterized membrane protein (Fun14 family)
MDEALSPDTLKQMGFGATLGFMVGFTLKRILKLMILVVGLYVLSLLWLADAGVLNVRWEGLAQLIGGLFSSTEGFARSAVRTLSFGGSFALGFALGMKV